MIYCTNCGKQLDESLNFCPECGADLIQQANSSIKKANIPVETKRKAVVKKWWFWVILATVIIGVASRCFIQKTGYNLNESTSLSSQSSAEQMIPTNALSDAPIIEESNKKTETILDDSISLEYRNALSQAEQYASVMHMSKQGIYQQLTSDYGERFHDDAAQYAIDNLDCDWKANALKKAEEYSNIMHISKNSIYNQLTSEYGEKFTAEEAQYAVDNVKADWKANALEKAKEYSDIMNMSKDGIYNQLTSEYGEKFTAEEAQYAVDHLE